MVTEGQEFIRAGDIFICPFARFATRQRRSATIIVRSFSQSVARYVLLNSGAARIKLRAGRSSPEFTCGRSLPD